MNDRIQQINNLLKLFRRQSFSFLTNFRHYNIDEYLNKQDNYCWGIDLLYLQLYVW